MARASAHANQRTSWLSPAGGAGSSAPSTVEQVAQVEVGVASAPRMHVEVSQRAAPRGWVRRRPSHLQAGLLRRLPHGRVPRASHPAPGGRPAAATGPAACGGAGSRPAVPMINGEPVTWVGSRVLVEGPGQAVQGHQHPVSGPGLAPVDGPAPPDRLLAHRPPGSTAESRGPIRLGRPRRRPVTLPCRCRRLADRLLAHPAQDLPVGSAATGMSSTHQPASRAASRVASAIAPRNRTLSGPPPDRRPAWSAASVVRPIRRSAPPPARSRRHRSDHVHAHGRGRRPGAGHGPFEASVTPSPAAQPPARSGQ